MSNIKYAHSEPKTKLLRQFKCINKDCYVTGFKSSIRHVSACPVCGKCTAVQIKTCLKCKKTFETESRIKKTCGEC